MFETCYFEIRFCFKTCRLNPAVSTLNLDRLFRWTSEAGEGYVSSSFLGAELSILTVLPERIVRKIL